MKAKLTIIKGEDQGLEIFVDDGESVVLGRSRSADVKIGDAEISRRHCEIRNTGKGLVLRDLGSSNGTYLNRKRTEKATLIDQDTFRIGSTTIAVTADADAESSAAIIPDRGMMGEFDDFLDGAAGPDIKKALPPSRPSRSGGRNAQESDVVDVPEDLLESTREPPGASNGYCAFEDDSDMESPDEGKSDRASDVGPDAAAASEPVTSESVIATDLIVGTTIAGCRVEQRLRDIDTCIVFRGTQESIGRPLTLYLLRPHIAADPDERRRFLHAARAAGRVYHPNVVHIYDAVETDEWVCMLMEYVEGYTAEDLMGQWVREGKFELKRAVDIVRQLSMALGAAHAQGVIHRNVRPANVLLTPEGLAKLSGLGMARWLDQPSSAATTPLRPTVGDVHYCAPEQVAGRPDVDHRADIYALGATLFALVTGRAPFEASPGADLARMATAQEPPSPMALNPEVPRELCAVIQKAMVRAPEKRFQSAQQMQEAIEAVEREM